MSTCASSLSIVVPAFDEEERLGATLEAALRYLYASVADFEILVVDDGSRDRTADIATEIGRRHPGVRLVRLPENRGKGAAVRAGVLAARGSRILFMDADGATPMSEIGKLSRSLDAGADVAIGSRELGRRDGRVDARLHRRLIGRTFHRVVEWISIEGFLDTQCGFKLFRGPVAKDLFSSSRVQGFGFDVEVLVLAELRGYRVDEVPVRWTHQPGSRVNFLSDPLRMMLDVLLIRWRVLRGEYAAPERRMTRIGLRMPSRPPARPDRATREGAATDATWKTPI